MAASPGPDPALLRRWLTALGLLATAEEVAGRGDDAGSSTALIAADAACETVLGILGSWSKLSLKPEPRFNDLLERALDATTHAGPLGPGLLADLRASHATRNTVVHHGATATAQQAALAMSCARRLLEALPGVSSWFGALPTGSGIVSGIASLLNASNLAGFLLAGEKAIDARDPGAVADAAARAHSALLFRVDPPIGQKALGWLDTWDARDLGRPGRHLIELGSAVRELQSWVSAAALGLNPVAYRRLRSTFGSHTRYVAGNESIRRAVEPTLADATRALVTVAEMAFRLWQLGGLVEGTEEEVAKVTFYRDSG